MGKFRTIVLLTLAATLAAVAQAQSSAVAARKILEKRCQSCHGSVQMSGLDLRQRETILKGGARGPAVKPGKADESILFQATARIGDLKMPPGKDVLSPDDLQVLRKWIEDGAPWGVEESSARQEPAWWSFRTPQKPGVPDLSKDPWVRNPIDAFVAVKLAEKGLKRAPEADRRTLIRRAYFDLVGVPPSPERVDRFVQDAAPDAYDKLIDELLASPAYGERWARHWLDVARYADSGGFETDIFYPNAWRYRDYVIKSLNEDKPYDRFLQEQVAGDELWPDNLDLEGTYQVSARKLEHLEARIGTGLYTLGPELHESNMNVPKLVYEQLTDAADTTGSAFLGLTLGCARCHDHKFDPIAQRDYYRFQAIFAPSYPADFTVVPRHYYSDYRQHYTGILVVSEARAAVRRFEENIRKRTVDAKKKEFPSEVVSAFEVPVEKRTRQQEELAAALSKAVSSIKLDDYYTPEEKKEHEKLLAEIGKAVLKLPEKDASQNIPFDGLIEIPAATGLAHHVPELIPDVHLLGRGNLDQPRDKVGPGTPAMLSNGSGDFEPTGAANFEERRKLALWLSRADHPLTSRVIVNRIWMWHFGRGIVATPNDFGRQGQLPSHPELLDWLATEFVDRGWSMKEMHRLIMCSSTYRQSGRYTSEANFRVDPENRLLWRMNRTRLEAEQLWDAMHTIAGTLSPKMGGRPVALPLSEEELGAVGNPAQWPVAADPAEFNRRGIYILNRRNFTYPMLQAFDSPDNAVSCPERDVTTVAPQALWFLNNNVAFQQALEFAGRLVKETGTEPDKWVQRAWNLAFGRPPSSTEKQQALDLIESLTKSSAQGKLPATLPASLSGLSSARAGGLTKLCLSLFNLNELIYVD